MKEKRFGIIILALALLAFVVSCSADDLQKTGESMGNIGKAGMGTAGETLVNDAVDTVEAFVANYEYCFRYYDPLYVIEVKEKEGVEVEVERAQSMPVKTEESDGYDGKKGLLDLSASVVSAEASYRPPASRSHSSA